MGYKMIVSDLDGTMFESDLKTNAKNLASIKKATENGCVFVIATGRPAYSTLAVARELGLNSKNQYIICFQGGTIKEVSTERTLLSLPLEHEYAMNIIKSARDKDATVIAYIDGLPYTHYFDKEASEYANMVGVNITVDEAFEDTCKGEYNKVLLRGKSESLKKIELQLSEWANGRVGTVYSSHNLLEYMNINVSKGRAVLMLAEKLGIAIEDVIAIGDYYNDLSMLKAAGLGVAIKGSPVEVLAVSGYVTERTAGEGAVSEVIERFVFGG